MTKLFTDNLDLGAAEIEELGGIATATEISQQPGVWKNVDELFKQKFHEFSSFINLALLEADQIIMTGAGTSAFIGYSIVGAMYKNLNIPCRVIATTDIVTNADSFFNNRGKYLIISFARSGNSPESIAALQLADHFAKKCFHFIITCNGEGSLASYNSKNPIRVFTLPEDADDKGLAMTSSYSSMLLTGLLMTFMAKRTDIDIDIQLNLSIHFANSILREDVNTLNEIAKKSFSRAVFLGSGPLYGTATEAALKLQELTNGNIICKSDTFLGFRHGPKAVVHDDTLLVYFFNNDPYIRKYETDLTSKMRESTHPLLQIGIGENISGFNELDFYIQPGDSSADIHKNFQPLSYIVPIQILGFLKSMQFKLKPDSPSSNGAISRVVQGVNIYQLQGFHTL